jgi:hypothetical protein
LTCEIKTCHLAQLLTTLPEQKISQIRARKWSGKGIPKVEVTNHRIGGAPPWANLSTMTIESRTIKQIQRRARDEENYRLFIATALLLHTMGGEKVRAGNHYNL